MLVCTQTHTQTDTQTHRLSLSLSVSVSLSLSLCVCVCVSVSLSFSPCGGQRTLDPLEKELLPGMGAGTQPQISYEVLTMGPLPDLSILFLRQSLSLMLALTDLAELIGQ